MRTWHSVHCWYFGSSMLCELAGRNTPPFSRPNVPAPLWHSRHIVNTTGRRSSFAFVDAVRHVARLAAFHAHAGMFEDERPALIHVALETGLFVIETALQHG